MKNDRRDRIPDKRAIFRRASKTYFNSSLFFPRAVRDDVFTLYAFVRSADDYVDSVPQDSRGFYAFRSAYEQARAGTSSGSAIIDDFVELARRCSFDPAWTDAFLDAMQADLAHSSYNTIDESLSYVYGSAEVIGCYMSRLLGLSPVAHRYAQLQGRAMQFINFVRDIAEDTRLGRSYLPMAETSLPDLSEESAGSDPEEFKRFLSRQLERYRLWQHEAEQGYRLIPARFRVAIQTAAEMYNWTARTIANDPFIVYRRKVKPMRAQVIGAALRNGATILGGRSWSFSPFGNRVSRST